MFKKAITTAFMAIMAVTFTACHKNQPVVLDEQPSDGSIVFGIQPGEGLVTGEVTTKAIKPATSVTTFKAECSTDVHGKTVVWNNRAFTNNGSGTYMASPKAYWPSTNTGYTFYAVCAAPTDANAAVITSVPDITAASGTNAADGPTIAVPVNYGRDLICAYLPYDSSSPGTTGTPTAGKAVYKAKNNLEFKHVFARISTVSVTNADGAATISNYTIKLKNVKTGGTYNLKTGNGQTNGTGWSSLLPADGTNPILLSNAGSLAPGAAASTTGSVYNATDQSLYIVPGTYKLIATWTASVDQYTQTYTSKESTASFAFVGGKINAINCRLTGDPAELQFSVSVAEWTNNSVGPADFNH